MGSPLTECPMIMTKDSTCCHTHLCTHSVQKIPKWDNPLIALVHVLPLVQRYCYGIQILCSGSRIRSHLSCVSIWPIVPNYSVAMSQAGMQWITNRYWVPLRHDTQEQHSVPYQATVITCCYRVTRGHSLYSRCYIAVFIYKVAVGRVTAHGGNLPSEQDKHMFQSESMK